MFLFYLLSFVTLGHLFKTAKNEKNVQRKKENQQKDNIHKKC